MGSSVVKMQRTYLLNSLEAKIRVVAEKARRGN